MKYLNAINKIPGFGPKTLEKLADSFPAFEDAWKADRETLLSRGLTEKSVEKFLAERKSIQPEAEWEKLQKEGIQMVSQRNPDFPVLLKEIPTCPFVLYFKGDIGILNRKRALSIVGSRKYSRYGEQAALKFSRELAASGITVVSGMALGIDSIAHLGALDARGQTVAVLGNSLDEKNIYPRYNLSLSRQIVASGGALISEYPVETPAGNFTFPSRNRIIAGATLGTLVIEAGEKSGSLITAGLALEFNREVLAVPGEIFSPASVGTNSLIRSGAKMVASLQDVLEEIGMEIETENTPAAAPKDMDGTEKILWEILSREPLHIDKLSKISKLETMTVSSTLSMMEIKGWIKNVGGQNYVIL